MVAGPVWVQKLVEAREAFESGKSPASFRSVLENHVWFRGARAANRRLIEALGIDEQEMPYRLSALQRDPDLGFSRALDEGTRQQFQQLSKQGWVERAVLAVAHAFTIHGADQKITDFFRGGPESAREQLTSKMREAGAANADAAEARRKLADLGVDLDSPEGQKTQARLERLMAKDQHLEEGVRLTKGVISRALASSSKARATTIDDHIETGDVNNWLSEDPEKPSDGQARYLYDWATAYEEMRSIASERCSNLPEVGESLAADRDYHLDRSQEAQTQADLQQDLQVLRRGGRGLDQAIQGLGEGLDL